MGGPIHTLPPTPLPLTEDPGRPPTPYPPTPGTRSRSHVRMCVTALRGRGAGRRFRCPASACTCMQQAQVSVSTGQSEVVSQGSVCLTEGQSEVYGHEIRMCASEQAMQDALSLSEGKEVGGRRSKRVLEEELDPVRSCLAPPGNSLLSLQNGGCAPAAACHCRRRPSRRRPREQS